MKMNEIAKVKGPRGPIRIFFNQKSNYFTIVCRGTFHKCSGRSLFYSMHSLKARAEVLFDKFIAMIIMDEVSKSFDSNSLSTYDFSDPSGSATNKVRHDYFKGGKLLSESIAL